MQTLTIWTNVKLSDEAMNRLIAGLGPHRLVRSAMLNESNLAGGGADPAMESAQIAFGQPDVEQVKRSATLRWVQLSSAGYARYDRDEIRAAMKSRAAMLTTASGVYAEPCAQHLLAMMLALARRLPESWQSQHASHEWAYLGRRDRSRLLGDDAVLMLGYGAIARRLTELLVPFQMKKLWALRRTPRGDEPVEIIGEADLAGVLGEADHVVNILPEAPKTRNMVDRQFLNRMKRGARFYNIGRGATVDQPALIEALDSGQLDAAYLDVTDPEPLPPEHPLWTTRNCWITPHTAGGHEREPQRLVDHFLDNLAEFQQNEPLRDRVI